MDIQILGLGIGGSWVPELWGVGWGLSDSSRGVSGCLSARVSRLSTHSHIHSHTLMRAHTYRILFFFMSNVCGTRHMVIVAPTGSQPRGGPNPAALSSLDYLNYKGNSSIELSYGALCAQTVLSYALQSL